MLEVTKRICQSLKNGKRLADATACATGFHLFLYATYGDIKQDSEFTFETVSFEPKVGDVFIFPSHVEHSVGKNKSKKNRISLAFNYLKK